jgi:hypothetical protein
MNDSPARPVVLDVWCELQCPDCRSALVDLRALRERYGDRLEDPRTVLELTLALGLAGGAAAPTDG